MIKKAQITVTAPLCSIDVSKYLWTISKYLFCVTHTNYVEFCWLVFCYDHSYLDSLLDISISRMCVFLVLVMA